MVYLLVLVEIDNILERGQVVPENIPVCLPFNHLKSRIFKGSDDRVVDKSGLLDLEGEEQLLYLVLLVELHSLALPLFLHVLWIVEEDNRRSFLEDALEEVDVIGLRFEYAVRKLSPVLLDPSVAERVRFYELLHFFH